MRAHSVVLGLIALYLILVASDGTPTMLLTALLTIICLGVLIKRAWRGDVHWLESGVVIGLFLALQYPNGAVYVHYFPERVARRVGIEDRLTYDLVLLIVGAVCWLGAYFAPLGRELSAKGPRLTREIRQESFLLTWSLGMLGCWILRIVHMQGLLDSALVSSYRNLPQLLLPIGVMMAVSLESAGAHRRRLWLPIAIGFLAEIAYQLPSTMKGNLFYPAFLSIAGYYLVRRQIPRTAAVAVVTALVIWTPVGLAYRSYRLGDGGRATREALGEAVIQSRDRDSLDVAYETGLYFLHRGQLVDVFDTVVTNIPDVEPYRLGATYTDIPLMLIPRVIWPNKPIFNYMKGEWGRDLAGVTPESEAVGMGMLAEFYFNFGPIGIAVGMALFGLFCRALFAWYEERNQRNVNAAIVYLVFLKQLTAIGALATAVTGMVQYTLMLWIFYRCSTVPRPRPRPEPWRPSRSRPYASARL